MFGGLFFLVFFLVILLLCFFGAELRERDKGLSRGGGPVSHAQVKPL